MKILADENVAGLIVRRLRERGHDVAWVQEDSPGVEDIIILRRAMQENRLLITFDKDFGELAFHSGRSASCGIILFRISMPSPAIAVERIINILESRSSWDGFFSVIDDLRIRMIPLIK
jgi:predicted nuclease of predicted toxin-antitoxin system